MEDAWLEHLHSS
uniref:ENOD40 n=1 Tax=Lolium perenne TaxID=4522 RepID=Q8GSB9_LOLPR|nr:ENOD40-like protein [Lolium perenne]AAN15134.1 ENOD40 [Lolium perenne]